MSTQYRDPPQWKQNASRDLDVKLFKRLEAASVLCDRFVHAASLQLEVMDEHIASGGDPLEAIMGSAAYAKMRAASEAEEKAGKGSGTVSAKAAETEPDPSGDKVPDPLGSAPAGDAKVDVHTGGGQAPFAAQKEPDPSSQKEPDPKPAKRKYVPRVNAAPFFVLAARAMDLQAELAPVVTELGKQLLAAGIDVRKLLQEDAVKRVIRDEWGMELEEITADDCDLMMEVIRDSHEWLREYKREHAEDYRQMEHPDPGEGKATDGK